VVRVIDIECDLPTAEVLAFRAATPASAQLGSGDTFRGREHEAPDGYGMANYGKVFRGRERTPVQPIELGAFADWLGTIGVEKAVIGTSSVPSNTYAAQVIAARPDRFLAFACISPWDGMRGVRELERLVRLLRADGVDLPRAPAR
jgi:predicted TIM-barrel fold metal-dependent hydrolase